MPQVSQILDVRGSELITLLTSPININSILIKSYHRSSCVLVFSRLQLRSRLATTAVMSINDGQGVVEVFCHCRKWFAGLRLLWVHRLYLGTSRLCLDTSKSPVTWLSRLPRDSRQVFRPPQFSKLSYTLRLQVTVWTRGRCSLLLFRTVDRNLVALRYMQHLRMCL